MINKPHPKGILILSLLLLPALAQAEFTNFLGIQFVDIPAGQFVMGSCHESGSEKSARKQDDFLGEDKGRTACKAGGVDTNAYDSETPQHSVRLAAFQMGQTELTLGQFKRYIKQSGKRSLISDDFIKYNSGSDSRPVVYVSWDDAQQFIKWLNKNKPSSDGGRYALPSESQWEYAARAGTTSVYSWGNSASKSTINQYARYTKKAYDAGQKYPHKVATKKPNGFGLYDMHGNVWEWVQDCWHDNYNNAPTDGSANLSGKCVDRVNRGGSWGYSARDLRSANRYYNSPDLRSIYLGVRLVRHP